MFSYIIKRIVSLLPTLFVVSLAVFLITYLMLIPTLSLAPLAELFALVLAIPFGILAAYKRGTAIDVVLVTRTLFGIAIPGFLPGMFFMLFFGARLQWFPVAGYAPLKDGLWNHLRYLTLPALSLSTVQAALITRMTRSSVLTVIGQSFGTLITGAIVTETLFNISGIGMLTINAINRRDIYVIPV